ncbi:MAG: O-antigen ligase family protein [Huintestinicola sp.]|uniref:O-antigen ligase family protein n=1 Tax=Huintestinicola sp. TaxID=2981661 RepID=UPI003EFF1ACD
MKIKKSLLLFLFLIIPFIKPAEYILDPYVDSFIDAWKVCASLIAIYMYIKKSELSPFIIFMSLYQISIVIPTAVNNIHNIRGPVVIMLSNISFAMIAELGIKHYKREFLSAMSIFGGLMCLIMAVTMFIYYPEGMDQKEFMDLLGDRNYYFLGHDNGSFFIVFAIQVFSIINCLDKKGRLTAGTVLFWLFVDGAYIYVRSGAAVTAIILLWLYLLFFYKKNISDIFNFRTYIAAVLCLFFSVVVFRLHVYFPFIVENVFHKNMTLSGRTVIWDRAFVYIKRSPLIGYGQEEMTVLLEKFGISHVHNIFLEILYKSGIVGLALYSVIVCLIAKKLMACRGNRINDFTAFALFLFYLISMVDYYESKYVIYGMIVLAYNMPYLIGGSEAVPAGEKGREQSL